MYATWTLEEIESRIDQIERENPEYDACPEALQAEHEALCAEKWTRVPMPLLGLFGV